MTDVPSTDDIRDIWVDHHLNPLSRAEGIALVPEYQQAFDAWLETIRADERRRDAIREVEAHDLRSQIEALADERADLRAKVLALESLQMRRLDDVYDWYVLRADVLALLDGGSE